MKHFQKILFAFLILAVFTSCKSAVYEWDDGSFERKTHDEETVTEIIATEHVWQ